MHEDVCTSMRVFVYPSNTFLNQIWATSANAVTNMFRQNHAILSGDFNAKRHIFKMIKIYLSTCSTEVQICKFNSTGQQIMFEHSILVSVNSCD